MAENLWAQSKDPAKRKKAYDAHQKGTDEREMRSKNVINQSPWDKLRHKDGDFKKKR